MTAPVCSKIKQCVHLWCPFLPGIIRSAARAAWGSTWGTCVSRRACCRTPWCTTTWPWSCCVESTTSCGWAVSLEDSRSTSFVRLQVQFVFLEERWTFGQIISVCFLEWKHLLAKQLFKYLTLKHFTSQMGNIYVITQVQYGGIFLRIWSLFCLVLRTRQNKKTSKNIQYILINYLLYDK